MAQKTPKQAKIVRFDFEKNGTDRKPKQCGYLEMQAATENQPATLTFYGEIVSSWWAAWGEDKYPQEIQNYMNSLDPAEPLDIYFNSPGGDVFAGIAIYNILHRHQGQKTGHVDGMAASIASVILMACDEIKMSLGSMIMIHKPWVTAQGDADYLRSRADTLDKCEQSAIDIYMARAKEGKTREDFATAMQAETWMTVEEAAEYFEVSQENTQAAAPAASALLDNYKHTPETLKKAKEAQATAQAEKEKTDAAQRREALAAAIVADLYNYGT